MLIVVENRNEFESSHDCQSVMDVLQIERVEKDDSLFTDKRTGTVACNIVENNFAC